MDSKNVDNGVNEGSNKCGRQLPAGKEHAAIDVLKAHGVPLPSNGTKYSVEEAVENIMQFPKRSKERGAVIKAMVSKSCVSSKTILYNIIRNEERGMNKLSITQATSTQGTRNLGLGYQGSYARWNIRYTVSWYGSIVLSLIPVKITDTIDYCGERIPCLDHTTPQTIDLCLLIGNTDIATKSTGHIPIREDVTHSGSEKWQRLCREEKLPQLKMVCRAPRDYFRRLCKLYFDPNIFPPPKNKKEGHNSTVFGRLRNYIENSARNSGSPVICNGGSNPYEKRFRCAYWNRNPCPSCQKLKRKCSSCHEEEDGKHPYNTFSCTLTFVVKWDIAGYYIPLLSKPHQFHNNGCGWHCCPKRK